MYKVLNLFPSGEYTLTEQSKKPNLTQLQGGVDGLIAPVDHFIRGRHTTAYVNDEGILIGQPPNLYATHFCKWPSGMLHGPLIAYWKTTTKRPNEFWDFFVLHNSDLINIGELAHDEA